MKMVRRLISRRGRALARRWRALARPSRALGLSGVVLAIGAGAALAATSAGGANHGQGVVRACIQPESGGSAARELSLPAGAGCPKGDTPIQWNERGIRGARGRAGARGRPGRHGLAGATGPVGPVGPQGVAGHVGAVGPGGAEGRQGQLGATGKEGPHGLTGKEGPTGQAGPVGSAGKAGLNGLPGLNGAPGKEGAKGATGPEGPKGATGAKGPEGPQGPQGQPGSVGAQGEEGPQGPPGQDGAPGGEGPPGPTASAFAVGEAEVGKSATQTIVTKVTIETKVESVLDANASATIFGGAASNEEVGCGIFIETSFGLREIGEETTTQVAAAEGQRSISAVGSTLDRLGEQSVPAGKHEVDLLCDKFGGAATVEVLKADLLVWATG
ncbi:MAG: hypothetical protein ACYCUM_00230 [Solirubrobacteraceae bacterium]